MRVMLVFFALFLSLIASSCSTLEQSPKYDNETISNESASSIIQNDAASQNSLSQQSNSITKSIIVHESLPEFILELRGESDIFTELSIINSSTGLEVYQDHIEDEMWGIRKDIFTVECIDMDFDDYQDIEIFAGYNGLWKKHIIYIFWDKATSTFIDDNYGLGMLGNPSFDTEQKLVRSMVRGSAVDHWFYKHRYINGELLTIEEISFNYFNVNWLDNYGAEKLKTLEPLYDGDRTDFIHYIEKQLDDETMEMIIVENKYTLGNKDGDVLAVYTLNSEVGLLLMQYDKYKYNELN